MIAVPALSLVGIDRLRQPRQRGSLEHQARRQAETAGIEEPQQGMVDPVGLGLQRLNSLVPQCLGKTVHQGVTDALLSVADHDSDRVERGDGLLPTEFATQDTGEYKPNQDAISIDANLYVVLRMLPSVSEPLLKESTAWLAKMLRIDGNHLFEIGRP
jgi:hypothetical protein